MYRPRNFTAVVLGNGARIIYTFDAIEPGYCRQTSRVGYPLGWAQRYVALGEVPTAARLACGPGMPVAHRCF
jgi:hypothetical protein